MRILEVVIGSADIRGHVSFEGLGVIGLRFADYTRNPKSY